MKKGFINNSVWIIGGKIVQMLLTLIVGSISARYLGTSNYGLINYGASYIALFTPIVTLGLYGIIVNEIVKRPKEDGVIIGSAIGLRIIASLISSICIIMLVMFVEKGNFLLIIVTGIQCITIMFQWADVFNYWCQSQYDSKTAVIIQLTAYMCTSAYKIYLLATAKSVEWFAFSMGLDYILQAISYVICFKKKGRSKLQFKLKESKRLLKNSYHYIFSALAGVIYSQIDRIMLGSMLNASAVGLYTAAYTVSTMWTFVLSALVDSVRPAIIHSKQIDECHYKRRIVQLYSVILYMSIVVSLGYCMVSKLIINILYGKEFTGASTTLCILTWGTAFSYLGVARSIWCVCEGYQKYEKYLSIVGAICNIILNVTLIPVLGMNGAAIATLATQILTNFVVPLFIKEMRENSIYIVQALNIKSVLNKELLIELKSKI